MTLKYEILKRLVKLIGIRRMWDLDAEEIVERKKKQNMRNRIPALEDPDLYIGTVMIDGFPVIRMIHKDPVQKACMFVIGGGMVSAPRPASVRKALKVAKQSGLDLYVPYYPLCTDYPITRSYRMIEKTYEEMLKKYKAEDITLLGTSSGGNLALGLIAHLNATESDLPKPGHVMAISPGTCPVSEAEENRMKELNRKDVAIPMSYMYLAETIMTHGEEVPDYMLHLQNGDYRELPYVTFIYGSDEVLYAFAPSLEDAMKRSDVPYEMIVGEGMFHCYPVFPIVKEAKEGWDLMIKKLKEG